MSSRSYGRLLAPLAGGVFALWGCAGPASKVPYATAPLAAPDPVAALPVTDIHRLGPSDVVTVGVFGAPEVSGDRRVDDAGNITLPLIGDVAARGATTGELAAAVRARLARYYVRPDVTVVLKDAVSARITVDGSVGAPGLYPLTGPTTLMQAVAIARGASEDANLRRVIVFRTVDGQRMAAAFDLAAIRANQQPDPAIYSADIVIVDGNRARRFFRDVLTTIPVLALFRPF